MEFDLIRNTELFNPQIINIFTLAGHGDRIVVTDRGFPLPKNSQTHIVDVGIAKNLPRVIDIVAPALKLLSVDRLILAAEVRTSNPEFVAQLERLIAEEGLKIPLVFIEHLQFKESVLQADNIPVHGFIRTGECTKYTNVIIECGVSF